MPVNEMELGIVVFTFQHLKDSVYFTNNEQDSATRVLVFVKRKRIKTLKNL